MKAISVCVDYSDYLAFTLPYNLKVLDDLCIVTTYRDKDTIALCRSLGVTYICSDACYRGGASFNKGALINIALDQIYTSSYSGWILHIDSDIVLDPDILTNIELDPKVFYGAKRFRCSNRDIAKYLKDGTLDFDLLRRDYNYIFKEEFGCGYFQLFHSSYLARYPEEYPTAGLSDIKFRDSFTKRDVLGYVVHLGTTEVNWEGRTSKEFQI